MKYLVDANVLSEPTKPSQHPRVVDSLRTHEPDIAVDPVILGELRFGILILPKGKRRALSFSSARAESVTAGRGIALTLLTF